MNTASRVEYFSTRGFQQSEAEILVLMEEAAAALFAAFPDQFILFGGASLVLFYGSPRVSRDLDLLPTTDEVPGKEHFKEVVERNLGPLAELFGFGMLKCTVEGAPDDQSRFWVHSGERLLFSIDLTRIGGTVLTSELIRKNVGGAGKSAVMTPTRNYLLLQKCEAFLGRAIVKPRDAFDISLLLSQGAALDVALKQHLDDYIRWREIEPDFIRARIHAVDPKHCTVELRHVLPAKLFTALERQQFNQLRKALETVFKHWLAGGRG